ncbi:major facilitator superfamily domain-containing protein [Scleroderma citrinum]
MSSVSFALESSSAKAIDTVEMGNATARTENIELYNPYVDVSSVDERKPIQKIDLRTIPWLSFLYLLCSLDCTSIGNAKLYSMEADLRLTDTQYLLCLTIFFISHTLFEIPSNIVLKCICPSIWLSALVVGWGVIMTLQGLVQNFSGLMAMRWLLGMVEAGFFPGIIYYLSCWYKRSSAAYVLQYFSLLQPCQGHSVVSLRRRCQTWTA